MTEIILGLGSNLGNRENNLRRAIEMIKAELLTNVTESEIYESKPLLPKNAPKNWGQGKDFFNIVICGNLKDKRIKPKEALRQIKGFEAALGREPAPKWAPRVIDIDILAWGNEVIDELGLKIPHPHMLERDFVMVPLAQILPAWRHPLNGAKT